MKTIDRIKQTEFGYGNGNCWQACIASMLRMKLEHVPHFAKNMDSWWEDTQKWMMDRNMFLIEVTNRDETYSHIPNGIHCILSWKSTRGDFAHSVIGRFMDDKIYYEFDPHPDETFLDGKVEHICFIGTLEY